MVEEDRGSPSRWSSIEVRLPLLIAVLLTLAVIAFVTGAHYAVKRALIGAATVRLEASAGRLTDLLRQSASDRLSEAAAMAGESALRELVLDSSGAGREAAASTLAALLDDPRILGAEVWSGDDELLLDARSPRPPVGWTAPDPRPPTGVGVGPIRWSGEVGFYEVTAEVVGREQTPGHVGYLVLHRRLSSAGTAEVITGLIGSQARMLLGNRTGKAGEAWTDLESRVDPPQVDLEGLVAGGVVEVDGRGRSLGVAVPLEGTPWLLWLEIPQAAALAPIRSVSRQLVILSLVVLLVGATAAHFVARGITRPLAQLTGAAEELAAGEVGRTVPMGRRDELGRLARAFDGMRQRVTETHRSLEDRVRRRTRDLEEFSYSVSHDLRAPLRAIDGLALMVEEDHVDGSGAEARRLLEGIRERARHMGGLIDGLLRYSQLCRESMEDGEVDMTDLVHSVAAPLRTGLGEPSEIIIGTLPATRGDARLLRQVWQIYLDNALKFSSRAEAARIQVGGKPTSDELVYWVRDNGVGFDPRYAHKLFTAFQRLHSPESFEGAGVGLALAKRMVESHGGRVWAEGCPGEGATFYFSLPAGGAGGRPSGSAGG